MALVKHHKVVAALPGTLEADSLYYVRVGTGLDIYVTNSSGQIIAYPVNQPGPKITVGTSPPSSPSPGDLWVDTN